MPRLTPERTFLAGKIIFNFGQSSLDCVVRRMSEEGATLQLETGLGVPDQFQLKLADDELLACRVVWRSDREIGVALGRVGGEVRNEAPSARRGDALMRSQMLALRAALDHVPTGIVLLDAQLRARLINRSFRQMWRLPEEVADSNPSILTLLYHGRDTGAYEVAAAGSTRSLRCASARSRQETPRRSICVEPTATSCACSAPLCPTVGGC